MKKVYIGMSLDFIHHGHMKIIEEARKYGSITLGLLTDKAISQKKQIPYLDYEKRKKIAQNLKGIDYVIPQDEWDYSFNIEKIKPDYFIHGDDWKSNDIKTRANVIEALSNHGGKLIEISHTKNINSSGLKKNLFNVGISPDIRRTSLKRNLQNKKILRFI